MKRGSSGGGNDAWLFGPESASGAELNSRKRLPGIRKSDYSLQRRRASSVGAAPSEVRGKSKGRPSRTKVVNTVAPLIGYSSGYRVVEVLPVGAE